MDISLDKLGNVVYEVGHSSFYFLLPPCVCVQGSTFDSYIITLSYHLFH